MKTVHNKTLTGVITSDAMDKTVVVRVGRYVKDPKYGKFYTKTKKYKAHDENNEYKEGETVIIQACRPLSKEKSFKVIARA